ncbi:MAG: hypothetical protein M3527_05940 [Actinomycetota bacterium]|nr:hypothetical protein [Actinomycetota bacterium]
MTTFVPVNSAALVPPRLRAAGVHVAELPAAEVAVIVHRGASRPRPRLPPPR